jgi:small subunit ribosomal protein S8e
MLNLTRSEMGLFQGNDLRKPSGGRKRSSRTKRKREIGSLPVETILSSEEKRVKVRVYGGNYKIKLLRALYANVTVNNNITKRVKILGVKENPANIDWSRRGVISKGAIINTELGLARVTSRPGSDGVINAVLIESK